MYFNSHLASFIYSFILIKVVCFTDSPNSYSFPIDSEVHFYYLFCLIFSFFMVVKCTCHNIWHLKHLKMCICLYWTLFLSDHVLPSPHSSFLGWTTFPKRTGLKLVVTVMPGVFENRRQFRQGDTYQRSEPDSRSRSGVKVFLRARTRHWFRFLGIQRQRRKNLDKEWAPRSQTSALET